MRWLSYLFPQTIARYSTTHNTDIRVNRERGRYKLLVNGSRESGAYIEMLWRDVFRSFCIGRSRKVTHILVLGVAGGSVIHLLSDLYPQAKIIGVDIDETMLLLGKTYFGLGRVAHLTLKRADAKTFVASEVKKNQRYDVVIVDLFCGRVIPQFVEEKRFLSNIKDILTPQGFSVINYLREREYKDKSNILISTLQQIFPVVKDRELYNNRFFMVKSLHVRIPRKTSRQ